MANQPGLDAAHQALYDAQLPQLDLAAQQASQARGMFYSGNAVDAQTKARADLLAKILAQQMSDTQATSEQERAIAQAQSAQENQTKAQNRATNLGLIGSGVGAATGLGGLMLMNRGANGLQNIVAGGPTGYMKMVNGQMVPVPVAGVGGAALQPMNAMNPNAAGVGGLAGLPGTGPSFDPMSGVPSIPTSLPATPGTGGIFGDPGGFNVAAGGRGVGAAPSAATPGAAVPASSMWSNPIEQLGAGAVGGAGGFLASRAAGAKGTGAAVGSGIGGLAGMGIGSALANSYGYGGNPYAAGAGALIGSFGGGLLGNLFK